MTELTGQDIADMKLDKLTEAHLRSVSIIIGEYEYFVKGYFLGDGFEVERVCRHEDGKLIKYGEPHRRHIQNNYEDKLVEACL